MITTDMLRAAVRSNDQLADHPEAAGEAIRMTMQEFDVDVHGLNHVSMQRAMRGFLAVVRPDLVERWSNGQPIGHFLTDDEGRILTLTAAVWIDGFSAALRVLKEGG